MKEGKGHTSEILQGFQRFKSGIREGLQRHNPIDRSKAAEKLQQVRQELHETLKTPEGRERAAGMAAEVAGSIPDAERLVLKSRQSRVEAEQTPFKRRGFMFYAAKTGIEMIPGGIGPYGIGDGLSLIEGLWGKEIGTGRKLDLVDRGISLLAALIPIVPATPLREGIRKFRQHVEDRVVKNVQKRQRLQ